MQLFFVRETRRLERLQKLKIVFGNVQGTTSPAVCRPLPFNATRASSGNNWYWIPSDCFLCSDTTVPVDPFDQDETVLAVAAVQRGHHLSGHALPGRTSVHATGLGGMESIKATTLAKRMILSCPGRNTIRVEVETGGFWWNLSQNMREDQINGGGHTQCVVPASKFTWCLNTFPPTKRKNLSKYRDNWICY